MVHGTAPNMTPDLRQIIDGVHRALPDVEWEQLPVKWAADDDGLWFFWRKGRMGEDVQIESSSGTCPFLIETARDAERRWGFTPAETIETVVALLR
jgi:hypothetical protein